MSAQVATIRGRLQFVVGDADPIELGTVSVPVTAQTTAQYESSPALDGSGHLVLTTSTDFADLRQLIQSIFDDTKETQ